MKISLVTPVLTNKAGGAEYVICSLADAFSQEGHEVEILHYADDVGAPFYNVDPKVSYFNIKPQFRPQGGLIRRLCRLGLKALGKLFPDLLWRAQHGAEVGWLKSYWRCYRPDLVIAFTAGSFSVTAEASSSLKIPYVLSIHNVPEKEFDDPARWDPNPADRARRKAALNACAAITVLSPKFQQYFPQSLQEKIHVIPNYVLVPEHLNQNKSVRPRRIISAGRLTEVKQHEMLIRAWHKLAPDFPDWSVAIYGEGFLGAHLKQLINDLNLSESIAIHKPTHQIWDQYCASAFMVHPARFEGFGLVVLEAMYCGIPTIAYRDCAGVNELIIDGKTGVLIDSSGEDVNSLSEAMREMILNDGRREKMGVSAKERANEYSKDKSLMAWREVLKRIS